MKTIGEALREHLGVQNLTVDRQGDQFNVVVGDHGLSLTILQDAEGDPWAGSMVFHLISNALVLAGFGSHHPLHITDEEYASFVEATT